MAFCCEDTSPQIKAVLLETIHDVKVILLSVIPCYSGGGTLAYRVSSTRDNIVNL